MDQNRRGLLRDSVMLGVALGAASIPLIGEPFQKSSNAGEKEEKEPEVTATEDLMREHSSGGLCSSTSRPYLSCGRIHPASMPLHCGKWRNSSERLERIITRECWKSSTFFP